MCVKFELEEAARCRHVMRMRNSVLLLDHKVLGTCVYLINSIYMWLILALHRITKRKSFNLIRKWISIFLGRLSNMKYKSHISNIARSLDVIMSSVAHYYLNDHAFRHTVTFVSCTLNGHEFYVHTGVTFAYWDSSKLRIKNYAVSVYYKYHSDGKLFLEKSRYLLW